MLENEKGLSDYSHMTDLPPKPRFIASGDQDMYIE